jgi:type IV pilus assembly protein PilO
MKMSAGAQIGIAFLIALLLTGALYWFWDKPAIENLAKVQADLAAKQAENAQLRQYEPKLQQLNQEIANLQQQMEIEKKIVPDTKDADQFMHLIQDNASGAGIDVRDLEAQAVNDKGFYSEVPFNVQVDGSFYGVLNFFQAMAKSERIVNISSLQMSTVKTPADAKAKKNYQYGPEESVVATCVATTFFSHEAKAAAAKGAKPAGQK